MLFEIGWKIADDVGRSHDPVPVVRGEGGHDGVGEAVLDVERVVVGLAAAGGRPDEAQLTGADVLEPEVAVAGEGAAVEGQVGDPLVGQGPHLEVIRRTATEDNVRLAPQVGHLTASQPGLSCDTEKNKA